MPEIHYATPLLGNEHPANIGKKVGCTPTAGQEKNNFFTLAEIKP